MAIGLGAAALSALPSLIQAGKGIGQSFRAQGIERDNVRPNYQTPRQIFESTNLTRGAYMDPNLPGQSLMQDRIGAQAQSGYRAAREAATGSAGLLAATTGINQGALDATRDLQIEAARQQERDQRMYQQALREEATYADREFDVNKMQPYLDAAAAASALREASSRNIMGAVKNITGIANAADIFNKGKGFLKPTEVSEMVTTLPSMTKMSSELPMRTTTRTGMVNAGQPMQMQVPVIASPGIPGRTELPQAPNWFGPPVDPIRTQPIDMMAYSNAYRPY